VQNYTSWSCAAALVQLVWSGQIPVSVRCREDYCAVGQHSWKADLEGERYAVAHLRWHIYPKWGVMMQDESIGQVEEEEEGNRDDGDYSPISVEG